jgi:hypothetical protein
MTLTRFLKEHHIYNSMYINHNEGFGTLVDIIEKYARAKRNETINEIYLMINNTEDRSQLINNIWQLKKK